MELDILEAYFFVSICVFVYLFWLIAGKNRENKELKDKLNSTILSKEHLKERNFELNNQNNKLYKKNKILEAEFLKLKEYLLLKVNNYFKENSNFQNMPPLQALREYHRIIDEVLKYYEEEFKSQDEAVDKISSLMADYLTRPILLEEQEMKYSSSIRKRALTVKEIREETNEIIKQHYCDYYKINFMLAEKKKAEALTKILEFINSNYKLSSYISKIIAEIETADFELLAQSLDYGSSKYRQNQISNLRQIRSETKAKIEKLKWAEYQLTYLLTLYPTLQEVIECEENIDIPIEEITDSDPVKNYLSNEEWKKLSTTEKNQLALDRYIESRKKSTWQIGRDYELYVGYLFKNKGYNVDFFGSYMGLEDLGRDLIAEKDGKTLIVQCKYWSKEKLIHEKHIMQLFGSLIAYKIENQTEDTTGLIITNITLSETAKKFANILNIKIVENLDIGDFPRIKCNIGHSESGKTYIYHLPMDFQYDKTKIEKKDELMVFTVAEAEKLGFRRTYKWHGDKQP